MHKTADKSGYLFLYGKIKALEKNLLPASKFITLCDAGTADRFFTDLSDTAYTNARDEDSFKQALVSRLVSEYKAIKSKVSDSTDIDLAMMRYEVFNFISFLSGSKTPASYVPAVYKDNWWDDEYLPRMFRSVKNRYEQAMSSRSGELIPEDLIEMLCMDYINSEYITKISSSKVIDYWKNMIDLKNLAKRLNTGSGLFFGGGNIDRSFWKNVSLEDDWPLKLRSHRLISRLLPVRERIEWEAAAETLLGENIKNMRRQVFGPESAFSYLISLQSEAVNLKRILTGINMDIPGLEIREALNLAYV